jgi:hypothetical protein
MKAEKILSSFKRWADEAILVKEGLVSVADFWAHMNASCPNKINKRGRFDAGLCSEDGLRSGT